ARCAAACSAAVTAAGPSPSFAVTLALSSASGSPLFAPSAGTDPAVELVPLPLAAAKATAATTAKSTALRLSARRHFLMLRLLRREIGPVRPKTDARESYMFRLVNQAICTSFYRADISRAAASPRASRAPCRASPPPRRRRGRPREAAGRSSPPP